MSAEQPTVDLLRKINDIVKHITDAKKTVPEMKNFSIKDGVANKDARKYYAMLRTNFSDEFYMVIDAKTVMTSHTVASKKGKGGKR